MQFCLAVNVDIPDVEFLHQHVPWKMFLLKNDNRLMAGVPESEKLGKWRMSIEFKPTSFTEFCDNIEKFHCCNFTGTCDIAVVCLNYSNKENNGRFLSLCFVQLHYIVDILILMW